MSNACVAEVQVIKHTPCVHSGKQNWGAWCVAGSAGKVAAKECMEVLVPHLITFLLTHPDIKSLKQVSNTNIILLCQPQSCPVNYTRLCMLVFIMKFARSRQQHLPNLYQTI